MKYIPIEKKYFSSKDYIDKCTELEENKNNTDMRRQDASKNKAKSKRKRRRFCF
jgi:hypothetical protein